MDNSFLKDVLASVPQSSKLFYDEEQNIQDNIKLHILIEIIEKTKEATLRELVLVGEIL